MAQPPSWSTTPPRHAVIVGCGLVGGSMAAALRRAWPRTRFTAVDRKGPRERALDQRLVHDAVTPRRLPHLVADSRHQLFLLAAPIDAVLAALPHFATPEVEGRLILDVSSVKQPVVEAARACPGFVGGHPMAGRAEAGVAHASRDLFRDADFALCPSARTTAADLRRARAVVRAVGAKPRIVDARVHDTIVALTSHLPHLLAPALVDQAATLSRSLAAEGVKEELVWALAGGAFRDATQVAKASPGLWTPILHHNRGPLVQALEAFEARLRKLRAALQAGENPLEEPNGLSGAKIARLRRSREGLLPPLPLQTPKTSGKIK